MEEGSDQQMPEILELPHSQEVVLPTSYPIESSLSSSQSASPVKSSASATQSLQPTDVNFNCSSSRAFVLKHDEVYTDITPSLRRPAMFATEVIEAIQNNTTHIHDTTVVSDEIDNVLESCDAEVAIDKVSSSDHHVSINEVSGIDHDVASSDTADLNSQDSTDDLHVVSIRDTVATNKPVLTTDTVSAHITGLTDDNAFSSHNVVDVGDIVDSGCGGIGDSASEAISTVHDDRSVTETNVELIADTDYVGEPSVIGLPLQQEPTFEIAAAADVIAVCIQPDVSQYEDDKTVVIDIADSQPDTAVSQSDAALATDTVQQDDETDEGHGVTADLKSATADADTDIKHPMQSPHSMFCFYFSF